jgi:hypothetical protein
MGSLQAVAQRVLSPYRDPAMTNETHKPSHAAPTPPLTDEERAAEQWATSAVHTRLPQVRTIAQRWQTSVTTITGLFGAATVLDADTAIRAIAPTWNYTYGALVAGSLLFAALALYLASLAGDPTGKVIPAGVRRQVQLSEEVFKIASSRLMWSRIWTLPAALLLIVALGVRWYAPQVPPTQSQNVSAETS